MLLLGCYAALVFTAALFTTASAVLPGVPAKSKPILENILIVTAGTRGDIQPFIAVGLALKDAGYNVRIHTCTTLVPLMQNLGLDAIGMYDDLAVLIQQNPNMVRALEQGNFLMIVKSSLEIISRVAGFAAAQIKEDAEKNPPDLILTSYNSEYAGWYGAIVHGVPYITAGLQSLYYNPNLMHFGMPKLFGGLHYYLLRDIIMSSNYYLNIPVDNVMGKGIMKAVTRMHYTESILNPVRPHLMLLSPLVAEHLAPNYPPEYYKFVGATVVDAKYQVRNNTAFGGHGILEQLETFIHQSDTPPVYMGWGSMTTQTPEAMAALAIEAAFHSNQRAIVLVGGGVGPLDMNALQFAPPVLEAGVMAYAQQNVLLVTAAPHEWLFPRVSCTVHHGGAGTTTSAFRAGVPTIVMPVAADQFDNSYLVRALGVGIGFEQRLGRITGKELGDAILHVMTNRTMIQASRNLAHKMLAEDGAGAAVKEIEAFWKEYCVTGKFFNVFPGRAPFDWPKFFIVQVIPGYAVLCLIWWIRRFSFATQTKKGDKAKID